MSRPDDAPLTSPIDLTATAAASAVAAPVVAPSSMPEIAHRDARCTCPEFQRDHVCDHVLMAAAVRMIRRMIDIHSDPNRPH